MKINIERLEKNLFELAKIGRNNAGGIDRALGDASDEEARRWLTAYWKEHLGLSADMDAAANMWIYAEGSEGLAPIAIGSHHDAVPNGGMYDGALGVLMATEIMETFKDNGYITRHPLKLVSFTGEEPNPFNVSTLGSKVISLPRSWRKSSKEMYEMDDYIILNLSSTESFIKDSFIKRGFNKKDSKTIAEVLMKADCCGIESHGIQRLFSYHKRVKDGGINPAPKMKVVKETPVSALIDADRAAGHVAGKYSMEIAIEKALKNGIGMVITKNSTHFGIAGYYSNMARQRNLIGIAMTNGLPAVVPTFGRELMLNTNPIAFAIPAEPEPFSFDGSTSTVTLGKIEVYNKLGKSLPHGWGLDENGSVTDDTAQVLYSCRNKGAVGGLTPLGGSEETCGYKGYGLALIVEILTGILASAPTSNHTWSTSDHAEFSHMFMAVDYGMFGDKNEIEKRLSIDMHPKS